MSRKTTICIIALLVSLLSCSRKDVDRQGNIKLRGESEVLLSGKTEGDFIQKGNASWYGKKYHGRKTSNGETYDMHAFTAAHKTLPFNTIVRVVNQDNDSEVRVRINDRGPFIKGRIIDLSKSAAKKIGLDISGIAPVKLYLGSPHEGPKENRPRVRQESHYKKAWTIQVGSFSEFARARALVSRFEDCGHRVRIEKYEAMYRVRIGSFSNRSQAEHAMENLDLAELEGWVLEDKIK